MRKTLPFLLLLLLFSGCYSESDLVSTYDQGYEEGYKDGYENALWDNVPLKSAIEELLAAKEYDAVIDIFEIYNYSVLGDYCGDAETKLLHSTIADCSNDIQYNNLVIFYNSIEAAITNGYTPHECLE